VQTRHNIPRAADVDRHGHARSGPSPSSLVSFPSAVSGLCGSTYQRQRRRGYWLDLSARSCSQVTYSTGCRPPQARSSLPSITVRVPFVRVLSHPSAPRALPASFHHSPTRRLEYIHARWHASSRAEPDAPFFEAGSTDEGEGGLRRSLGNRLGMLLSHRSIPSSLLAPSPISCLFV
jgi:hypothetical protein